MSQHDNNNGQEYGPGQAEQNEQLSFGAYEADPGPGRPVYSGEPAAAGIVCCPAAAAFFSQEKRKKSWRKRHPFLFWVLFILILLILLNACGLLFKYLDDRGVFSGPRLGMIRVQGMILDSRPVLEWTERLRKDPSVHGVLLYINSPGGAVVPSQEIHAAIKRLAASKPVVVYMSSAAASGGYYIAVAGDHIVASPSTLTGSIGVRMEMAEMKELFDTLGIHPQSLASGALKEAGTPFRPMREDERDYLQGIVQDMYECFIEDVAQGRKMSLEQVRALADGRAYTGRQAKELGLVDEVGDSARAWQALIARAKLKEAPREYLDGPPKESSLLRELLTGALLQLEDASARAKNPMPGFYY